MGRSEVIERLLEAIEQGRVPVETVLRGLRGLPGFEETARALAEAIGAREPRRMTLRELQLPVQAFDACLEAFSRQLPAQSGALSTHWGKAYRGGRRGEGVALVVVVERKRDLRELDERSRIAGPFHYLHEGTEYVIPVDVQVAEEGMKQAGECRRGRGAVSVEHGGGGTISAVVETAAGATLICSGHVARTIGAAISIHDFSGDVVHQGTVKKVVDDEVLDGATVELPLAVGRKCSHAVPAELRDLHGGDVDLAVSVERASDGSEVLAFVEAIGVSTSFGGRPMRGLIRLDRTASRPGDSGAPVLDLGKGLIGFVIGVSAVHGQTYVIPARRLIDGLV